MGKLGWVEKGSSRGCHEREWQPSPRPAPLQLEKQTLLVWVPGREAALAWASLAQRSPASSVLAREGAGCGSVGDVPGAWLG